MEASRLSPLSTRPGSETCRGSLLESPDRAMLPKSDEWPFIWDWEGICEAPGERLSRVARVMKTYSDIPLHKLPKPVIEHVARLLTNKDRRHLSQTCRRLFEILGGSHALSLDRRHIVDLRVRYNDNGPGVLVHVQYVQYKTRWSEEDFDDSKYFRKHYKGDRALAKCRAYVKLCGDKYALRSVTWDLFYAWDTAVSARELVETVPAEVCDELRVVCPPMRTDYAEVFELEIVQLLLEKDNLKRITFHEETKPDEEEMAEYAEMVEKWCKQNGYGTVTCPGYRFTGFSKRVLDRKPYIVAGKFSEKDDVRPDGIIRNHDVNFYDEPWYYWPHQAYPDF